MTTRAAVIFCIFFVLAAKLACAQKDYVINKKHDTIYCDIKTNVVSGDLKYQPNGQDKYTIIDSDNVIEYYTAADSSTYVFKKLPGPNPGSHFLNWIEKGKINLYEQEVYTGANGEATTFWYAAKGEGALALIKVSGVVTGDIGQRKERRMAFMKMIADFPALLDAFDDEAYTFDNIENCVINYNNRFLAASKKLQ